MAYSRPYRYCHGCPARLTGNAQKWCPVCRPKAKAPKASSAQRGYDHAHRKERKRWEPIVEAGNAHCHAVRCLLRTRWIPPGSRWDLGHKLDRTGWTGPEHPVCNRTEGARRGGLAVAAKKRGNVRARPQRPNMPTSDVRTGYPVARQPEWQSRAW